MKRKYSGVSARYCPTFKILNALDLDKIEKIHPNATVGLTAGASTPDRIIEEVINKMEEMKNTEEMSFEELLNQSFKTLSSGEEVTVVERRMDWVRIRSGSAEGWVHAKDITSLWSPKSAGDI